MGSSFLNKTQQAVLKGFVCSPGVGGIFLEGEEKCPQAEFLPSLCSTPSIPNIKLINTP